MARTHAPYPVQLRRHLVELFRDGRTAEELAREFEPSAETIRRWAKTAIHILLLTESMSASSTRMGPKRLISSRHDQSTSGAEVPVPASGRLGLQPTTRPTIADDSTTRDLRCLSCESAGAKEVTMPECNR